MRRLLLLGFLLGSVAFAKSRVTIPKEVTVKGEWIRLGEIAIIQGERDALRDITLGKAPLPGSERILRCAMIKAKVGEGVKLSCPGKVKVKRAFQRLTEDQIKEIVLEHLKGKLPFARRLELEDFKISGKAILPVGKVRYLVFENSRKILGRASFTVLLRVGNFEQKVLVSGVVRAWAPVPLASRRINRHQLLMPQDITMRELELSRLPRSIVLDPRWLYGKRTLTSIPRGSPFRWDQVEVPPAVRRGDVVKVIVDTPRVRAQVLAVVLEEGRIGETIRVRNLSSGKEFLAEVVSESILKVRGL